MERLWGVVVMNDWNLTDGQKELLRKLVEAIRSGKLKEPILPIGLRDEYIIQLSGNEKIKFKWTGDLAALCEAGLLGSQWNTQETSLLYSIRQAGYDAVDNNFQSPPPSTDIQYNIGAMIQTMSGGNLQAVGVAKETNISQVVNDPELLQSHVNSLTQELLDAVKSELSGNDLINYTQAIKDFKEELLTEKPSSSLIKRLTKTLSFLSDVEGTISLMVMAWTYLYPLLLIAAERI
jgi:hypothetical protein